MISSQCPLDSEIPINARNRVPPLSEQAYVSNRVYKIVARCNCLIPTAYRQILTLAISRLSVYL